MNHKEFEAAVKKVMPYLRRYARFLKRSPSEEDDLVQATIARALDKLDKYEPIEGKTFQDWIIVIMHGMNINDIRKSVRERAVITSEGIEVDMPGYSRQLAVSGGQDMAMLVRDIEKVMKAMPPTMMRPLLMRHEGRSYDEIQEAEGIPIGTVRSRISRGRDFLRRALNGEAPSLP